ncbi:TAXI family TRAP transporter solute-binding subunit [Salinisphaera orenii]|uniref:TAXI family TRAP transporter solute-binding subunit n=1 Tax=Salinisphaera orenii TaxID=856731 RepID=UPI000DBE478D
MMFRCLKITLAVSLVFGVVSMAAAKTFITMGSGSTSGLYYPTAVGMSKIINEADVPIRANARSTGASVYNCRAIGKGQLQMGISQNNVAYYAYHGAGIQAFQDNAIKNLRGVTVLYPETIQILARKDADIDSIADMANKRVYVGDIGSGTEQDVKHLFAAYDLNLDDLKSPVRGSSGDAVGLLRDGKIDAMFYSVGLGASAITEAAQTAPIKLVSLSQSKIDQLHDKYSFYTGVTIPGGTYPGVDNDVRAVTLKAMLLTTADLSKKTVKQFMNVVFDKNIDAFYNDIQNPNLKKFFKLETALKGMSIPLHPGAVAFFESHGIKVPDDVKPSAA